MFIRALPHAKEKMLGLCLVMGGFFDGILGKAYAVANVLPDIVRNNFDVYYREHDEDADARAIITAYGAARLPIIIIGHSWGASSCVLDVLARPPVRAVPITALLTLDPVGLRMPQKLPGVRRWSNVYVDYKRAPRTRQNIIALIGHPWGAIAPASANHIFSGQNHADAIGMYKEWGEAFILPAIR